MPRITITGETLPPELPATARVWRDGLLDPQHLKVIQTVVRDLPADTLRDSVEDAERFLAEQASKLRPDQLEKVTNRCAVLINPDGKFTDIERARRRGFTWSPQRSDGMSIGKLVASPGLRANLDAWLVRFAAPGAGLSGDENTCATEGPDTRSHAQRQHDALNALVRGQLGDPKLGVHNGLPVTVIVSTTLQELSAAAGQGVTGGGTLLPMRDLIRMAGRAYHYLAVFDGHRKRPLYLGRARRIASADQRLVLYAKDRGWGSPGCDVPAYWTEVHHNDDWARGGRTDIDRLALLASLTINWLIKAGGQQKSETAIPSGFRRHISTTARRESMTIIIRNAFLARSARASERFDFRSYHRAFTRRITKRTRSQKLL
jgi:hypothetical protein